MNDTLDLSGSWENQNGSLLTIQESDGGEFSGVFESKKGRAAADKHYPIVGVQNGEILSFIVNFNSEEENLHSITSFSARYLKSREGEDQIHTLWVLTRQFEDQQRTKPTQVWNSFLTNADVFTRIETG